MIGGVGDWSIRLFGGLDLERSDGLVVARRGRKADQLLALLALRPDQSVTRDQAAGLLWPDAEIHDARNRLNVTLNRLRAAFGAEALPFQVDRAAFCLPTGRLGCDVVEFRRLLRRAKHAPDDLFRAALLGDALGLVGGEFLTGHDEPWIDCERRLLHREILGAISDAAGYVAQFGNATGVLECATEAARWLPNPLDVRAVLQSLAESDRIVDARLLDFESTRLIDPPRPILADERRRWDAARDFDAATNPNGAWSFGWTWDVGQPFSAFRHRGELASPAGRVQRLRTASWAELCALVNDLGRDLPYNEFVLKTRQLLLHPGDQGQKSVARWSAPRSGRYAVRCAFEAISPDATCDVLLVEGDRVLHESYIRPGGETVAWAGVYDLATDEALDAVVGSGNDGNYRDSVGLEFLVEPN